MSFLLKIWDGLDKQKAESDRVQAERAKAEADRPCNVAETEIRAELAIINNRLYHIEKRLGIRT